MPHGEWLVSSLKNQPIRFKETIVVSSENRNRTSTLLAKDAVVQNVENQVRTAATAELYAVKLNAERSVFST
jgi:hypothetical protein